MRATIITLIVVAVVLAVMGVFLFSQQTVGPITPEPAADRTEPKGRPRAVVVGSTTHEFGRMYQQTEGAHTFIVRNEGDRPLELTKGGTSCGCTGLDVHQEPIAPGQEGRVTLHWKTKMHPLFRETGTVFTNDPAQREITFTVTGQVLTAYLVSPSEIDFGKVPKAQAVTRTVELWSEDSADLTIQGVSASADRFSTQVEAFSAQELEARRAKAGFRVHVTLRPGGATGPLQAKLVITTSHPQRPTAEVSLQGHVIGEVSAQPEALNFLYVYPSGKTLTAWIYRRSKGALKVAIEEVQPGFLKAVLAEHPGKAAPYSLEVSVPAGAPRGPFRGQVKLKTDNPDTPVLVIPVEGLVLTGASGGP